ncbi:MAG: putative Na+/H+ antiporter, partial [Puniceicoccales bacterium]|nr:putative Na+/H+ antiporter [Puniceicoccales bacterium]
MWYFSIFSLELSYKNNSLNAVRSKFSPISVVVSCVLFLVFLSGTAYATTAHSTINFPISLQEYQALEAGKNLSLGGILKHRIRVSPFNLIATILFLCAIIHTFFASWFIVLSKKIADSNAGNSPGKHFLATICHFFGEVEAVFGLWAIP